MRMRKMTCGLMVFATIGGLAYLTRPQHAVFATATNAVEKGREADHEAILKSSRDFAVAFNAGDAKSIAAMYTLQGESHEAGGEIVRGRAAIEKAFADFFKANPQARVEVIVGSVRFPATDLAIEEGLLRVTRGGKELLPSSSAYSVVHAREGGHWLMALTREWGVGQDRLEDLDWLLGTWKAALGGNEATLTFKHDANKPFILGTFTKKEAGKEPVSGTIRLMLDPESGRLRGWHFDDDGGHGQSMWVRDRNNWVLDTRGVTADGIPTASVNIITRIGTDEITMRSIDRVIDGKPVPDTIPVRLTRTPGK